MRSLCYNDDVMDFFADCGKNVNRRGRCTPFKVYFEDIGLRNAGLDFRQIEPSHIMENIIYNELRYRSYKVDVGVVEVREKNAEGKEQRKQLEIDFIANQGSRRYYSQSAYAILCCAGTKAISQPRADAAFNSVRSMILAQFSGTERTS